MSPLPVPHRVGFQLPQFKLPQLPQLPGWPMAAADAPAVASATTKLEADFSGRWQKVHSAPRRGAPGACATVTESSCRPPLEAPSARTSGAHRATWAAWERPPHSVCAVGVRGGAHVP